MFLSAIIRKIVLFYKQKSLETFFQPELQEKKQQAKIKSSENKMKQTENPMTENTD